MDDTRQSTAPAAERAPTAWPRAVLFDLDGTLIDSVPDIAAAMNEVLALDGLPPLSEPEIRGMVGNGLPVLLQRVLAARGLTLESAAFAEKLAEAAEIYVRHLTGGTTVMAGAREVLDALAGSGTLLAVVTNKLQAATLTVLEHFELLDYFGVVVGDAGLAPKPDPAMLLHAASELGQRPEDVVMVGDSRADVEAGRRAGMAVIGVRGGYTDVAMDALAPDRVIDGLAELPTALASLAAARR